MNRHLVDPLLWDGPLRPAELLRGPLQGSQQSLSKDPVRD